MLPDTLLGLVVFAAGAGPGYLYVRLSQVRAPRYQRTPLEEAAELVVFGAATSALAVFSALAIGKLTGILDTTQIAKAPADYAFREPARALAGLVAVLALSYGAVWLFTTRILHRGDDKPRIAPGESAWYAAFHRMVPAGRGVYGTVDLDDGTALAGLVIAYTIETDEPRELILSKPVDQPLWLRTSDGELRSLPDTFVIIPSCRVAAIYGRYVPLANDGDRATQRTAPGRGRRRRSGILGA